MANGPKPLILLKLTGELFATPKLAPTAQHSQLVVDLIAQIKQLRATHQFAFVMGGGNFFRGNQHGKAFQLQASTAHQVGLLATVMNSLILQDLFAQHGLPATVLSAIECPQIAAAISTPNIQTALHQQHCLIFAGGTGEPFFSTDTAAVLRALQIKAQVVWKATNVDGIFTADPRTNAQAQLLSHLSYQEALAQRLQILDQTALILAREHALPIRVFNLFTPQALWRAAHDQNFGSLLSA